MGKNIGIDFGTTYSMMAEIVQNVDGSISPKSLSVINEASDRVNDGIFYDSLVLRDDETGELECGIAAHNNVGKPGKTAFRGFKLLLAEDEKSELLKAGGYTKECMPKDVVKKFLCELLGRYKDDIDNIRVGIPLVWSDAELNDVPQERLRDILKDELKIAEEKIDFVDEPTAACGYYIEQYRRHNNGNVYEGYVLLVDYGGGTLDITLCAVKDDDNVPQIQIIDKAGAGANTSKRIGEAGLAFMNEVVLNAMKEDFSQKDIETAVRHGHFDEAVFSLEIEIKQFGNKFDEVRRAIRNNPRLKDDQQYCEANKKYFAFLDAFSEFDLDRLDEFLGDNEELFELCIDKPKELEEGLAWIQKRRPITIGNIAKAYKKVIYNVLRDGLDSIIDTMEKNHIPYKAGSDQLKIQLIGGFSNFFLVEQQIITRLGIPVDKSDDSRFKGELEGADERAKAVAYGAALEADGKSKHIGTWHYSIGIQGVDLDPETGEKEVFWAAENNQERITDKVYLFKSRYGAIPCDPARQIDKFIYVSAYSKERKEMPIKDEGLVRKMSFESSSLGYLFGVSLDRYGVITFHWWQITNPSDFDEHAPVLEDMLFNGEDVPEIKEGRKGSIRLKALFDLDEKEGNRNLGR